MPAPLPAKDNTQFTRKQLFIESKKDLGPEHQLNEVTVLVTNASQNMAKEITLQLGLAMPGCSLIYAPTVEIARLVLKRRQIDLVISSPMLPDGAVSSLRGALESLDSPPDLIVIGERSSLDFNLVQRSAYRFSKIRNVGGSEDYNGAPFKKDGTQKSTDRSLATKVKTLGADLRNDLNNPLQEIVAMVFVAKSSSTSNANTELALNAIDQAAKSMAQVVGKLEDKIRESIDQ